MKSPILTSLTSGIIALAIALTVHHCTDELRQVLGAKHLFDKQVLLSSVLFAAALLSKNWLYKRITRRKN